MKKVSIISILLLNALFAFSQVTYQYDNLYRLQKVEYSNGVKVEYTYDELGNRLTKTVSSSNAVTDVSLNETLVYPNPVHDQLIIEHAAMNHAIIYSIDGQKVYENPNLSEKEIISISNWNTGLYLIKIQTDKGEVWVEKVIKE
jgi:YD repeat-containing protein